VREVLAVYALGGFGCPGELLEPYGAGPFRDAGDTGGERGGKGRGIGKRTGARGLPGSKSMTKL
jgi:hypothetical protein